LHRQNRKPDMLKTKNQEAAMELAMQYLDKLLKMEGMVRQSFEANRQKP